MTLLSIDFAHLNAGWFIGGFVVLMFGLFAIIKWWSDNVP